jgi:hypothetical protein
MAFAVFARLLRVRVTLIYAAALVVVTAALAELGPDAAARVIQHASTNLHNLSHGHLGTLLGSAFVVDGGPMYEWLPGLVCLLGLGELVWRSGRLLVAFAVGHVGATLLVAIGLLATVRFGWLPRDVALATDVGTSYGATAVLGALTPAIPRRLRPTWIGWWLGVGVTVASGATDFTDVGHLVALVLGMVAATRFGHPPRWTPIGVALLGIGAPYGYLILVGGGGATTPATAVGLAGAALGTVVTLLGRRPWPILLSHGIFGRE